MKKDFSGMLGRAASRSPAMNYVTPKEEPEAPKEPKTAPVRAAVSRSSTKGKESKSKRFQILIKPSTYERLKKKADREADSINNIINSILEANV